MAKRLATFCISSSDTGDKAWDNRNNISQRKTANLTSLDPTLHLWYNKRGENGKVSWMNFNYNFNHNMRDASQLLDIYDDTNPLFIREPNTNLRNPRNHHIEFGWGYGNMVHTQNYGFGGSWDVNSNSVATATLYDRNTGITTYRPLNISGNWSANLNGRFSLAEGNLKPYSTSVSLRARSPLYIPRICGTVTWDSSIIVRKSSGKYFKSE